jgi:hypothetical protein
VLTDIETKGLVVIDSKPQGATIYLNDKRKGAFGKTPWQGSLESKPVRLILEQKGWKAEERAISPRSDKLIDVYIALSEEHYLGWIEITSNVPGADVFIDRKEIGAIGRTPFTGHLKPGKHTIFVERFGYDPIQRIIDVTPGTATQHAFDMQAAQKGWVAISGRGVSGGRLIIDEKFACRDAVPHGGHARQNTRSSSRRKAWRTTSPTSRSRAASRPRSRCRCLRARRARARSPPRWSPRC